MTVSMPEPGKWILVAFSSLVTPWQDKITSLELISPYYQPRVAMVASILAIFVGVTLLAIYEKVSRRRKNRALFGSAALFFVTMIACLLLSLTVDVTWTPDASNVGRLGMIWVVVYILVSISAAACIGLLVLIFSPSKQSSSIP